MKGESELRNGLSMHHLVLNTDLEAIVETGIASTSLTILDSTWYLSELAFHHPKSSNFTFLPLSQFSAKIFFNLIATPYRLLNLQETLILRINHCIWISITNCITFYVCPLTPTWYYHIW